MKPLFSEAKALQDLLIRRATGGHGDDNEYRRLRQCFMEKAALRPLLPTFIGQCHDLNQFWAFIKPKFATYSERRDFLWSEFHHLLDSLDAGVAAPSDTLVASAISAFSSVHIDAAWRKALERRDNDPEGAITAARTLLEATCKHILEERGKPYSDGADIRQLYRQTAESLNIAPSQHTEEVFKQILGGCTSVVEGLGALRNRLSDAHGKGRRAVRPGPRHAELAVNLAGAVARFLQATHEHGPGGNER